MEDIPCSQTKQAVESLEVTCDHWDLENKKVQ